MSQPTMPNHPQTSAAGRHFGPPGSRLQDAPIPPGIHDDSRDRRHTVRPTRQLCTRATKAPTVGQIRTIIWFVKTNNALNAYWRSLDVR
jgi:hypothetical protein